MNRRNRTIIIVSIFVVLTFLIIFIILIHKKTIYGDPVYWEKYQQYYNMMDSYGSEYEEEWYSTDGHILLTINNCRSIYGRGRYKGFYKVDEKVYNVEIMIEGYEGYLEGGISYAELSTQSLSKNNQLYFGIYTIDYKNDTLKIIVNNDFDDEERMIDSIYKNGDEIIFKKAE